MEQDSMVRHKEIEVANERAAARLSQTPTATAARYDRRIGRLVIDLSTGMSISFRPHDAQGFERAKPEQLTKIEISPSGLGLHFPAIDADIYLPGLLAGFLGSHRWMATQLGKAAAAQHPPLKLRQYGQMASSAGGQKKPTLRASHELRTSVFRAGPRLSSSFQR
jgi:hypothetical protein